MNKLFLILMSIIFFSYNHVVLSDEIISYSNGYKGLEVNKSTLQDVINIFGSPIKTTGVNATIKYYYSDAHITLNGVTGKVNTIIIFDTGYIDSNGLQVGDSKFRVQSLQGIDVQNTIVDKEKGIIYWFENNKVSKIVLAGSLLKPPRQ